MRRTVELLWAIALLLGRGSERIAVDPLRGNPPELPAEPALSGPGETEERRDLDALRRATAGFLQFERAKASGWSTEITGCMTDPRGGMGYHYGNAKLIDATVRADEPEFLLYEPESNGQMRLVGVEYVVPIAAWHETRPPRLFGRDFAVNDAFQLWALHVWAWEANPSGMYNDWNPRVFCDE